MSPGTGAMPRAGVLFRGGGWLQLGGLHSHPNLRSLRGAFGSFDLPLVAEHHGHGVYSRTWTSMTLGGVGQELCGLSFTSCLHSNPWGKGLLILNIYFS